MLAVDGDPHFIIAVPQKEDALCFNIYEEPGKVLNLIRDPTTGKLFLENLEHISGKCEFDEIIYSTKCCCQIICFPHVSALQSM